ncbi:MAG TPA: hypothetical protein VK508_11380 [Cyclobacteriaceae bacterium]|nr:hypothetical protein [Cyclobacteriaceae bacterium]
MKRVILMVVCLSAALVCRAQTTVLKKVWATSTSGEGLQRVETRVGKLVSQLEKRHYRNDVRKLHALFTKTHNRFLHSYVQYTGIDQLAKGRYDCLTATSLFADILTRSGFSYNIIETNYHIFIVVNTKDGDVVLETTDRLGGFVNDEKKKDGMIAEYKKNILASATPSHHQYSFSLYQPVSTDQLAGLLYFNQAVNAFNAGKWEECSEKLSAATLTTNSPRIADLTAMLRQQADNK